MDLTENGSNGNSSRRGVGGRIPIPRFAAAAAAAKASGNDIDEEDDEVAATRPTTTTTSGGHEASAEMVVRTTWSPEHLACLERYLFLYLKKQKASCISLEELYNITRKSLFQIRSDSSSSSNSSSIQEQQRDDEDDDESYNNGNLSRRGKPPSYRGNKIQYDDLDDLTEEERLVYHLVAATSPTLYKLVVKTEQEIHRNVIGRKNNNDGDEKEKKIWCLESIDLSTRKLEFRKLLKQKTIRKEKSDAILQSIRTHRYSIIQKKKQLERQRRNKKSPSPKQDRRRVAATADAILVIKPGMTIEERVRARADALSRYEAKQQQQQEESQATCGRTAVDPEWLLRFADALWLHASEAVPKRLGMTVPTKSKVTLQEAVRILRSSVGKGSEVTSKRKVVHAIMELQRRFPHWIVILDPNKAAGAGEGAEPSADAILEIHSVESYGAIRAQITASDRITTTEKPTKMKKKSPTRKQKLHHPGRNSILNPGNKNVQHKPSLPKTSLARTGWPSPSLVASRKVNRACKDTSSLGTVLAIRHATSAGDRVSALLNQEDDDGLIATTLAGTKRHLLEAPPPLSSTKAKVLRVSPPQDRRMQA